MINLFRKIKEWDRIKLTYLPSCRNAPGNKNPYIGMEGTVYDVRAGYFDLYTGSSWLVAIRVNSCKYELIK
jgi:hypothetical protein